MKRLILSLNQFKSVRLLLPVLLGFVILTASTNLPDFDEAVASFKISKSDSSLGSQESAHFVGSDSRAVMDSGMALGWGQTSEVLP